MSVGRAGALGAGASGAAVAGDGPAAGLGQKSFPRKFFE